jgi:hypothetical protein
MRKTFELGSPSGNCTLLELEICEVPNGRLSLALAGARTFQVLDPYTRQFLTLFPTVSELSSQCSDEPMLILSILSRLILIG